MIVIDYPKKGGLFHRVKYLVIIVILGYKVPECWCVSGQANLRYSADISFLPVILSAIVVHWALCKYVCPDGGLLRLINREKKKFK
jgi:hypothetical protein